MYERFYMWSGKYCVIFPLFFRFLPPPPSTHAIWNVNVSQCLQIGWWKWKWKFEHDKYWWNFHLFLFSVILGNWINFVFAIRWKISFVDHKLTACSTSHLIPFAHISSCTGWQWTLDVLPLIKSNVFGLRMGTRRGKMFANIRNFPCLDAHNWRKRIEWKNTHRKWMEIFTLHVYAEKSEMK